MYQIITSVVLVFFSDILGVPFVNFVLDNIEYPPDTDVDEQIPDLFLNLIISFNLQFSSSDNVVMAALEQRDVAKTFTEKILLLLNREGGFRSLKNHYNHKVMVFRGSCENF